MRTNVRRQFAILFLIVTMPLGLAACDQSGLKRAEPPIVQRLRSFWESIPNRHAGKTEYGEAVLAFRAQFQDEVNAGGLEALLRYATESGEAADEISFLVQETLLDLLIVRGDLARLRRLLSTVVIAGSSYWSLEMVLASPRMGSPLKDGIPLLFEAYEEAKRLPVRESLYLAAWRAFGDAPSASRTPDEYMRAARTWYTDHRDKLERVRGYDHNDLIEWRDGVLTFADGESPPHLFSLK